MKNRNKILIILGSILIIAAIVFLIVGFALSGTNILAWFGSKWAMWFYLFLGLYALVVCGFFILEWIKRL